jgi:ubiquinone/menaquinone biosynthesis C-methylase UbiE
MYHHFSNIAGKYRDLRKTDLEPISLIANKLQYLTHIEAADVGCGAGRYDLLLYRHLSDKLRLTCLDANPDMLRSLDEHLERHGVSNFTTICSRAESLPFQDNFLDCICTFNAIHHFNLPAFLSESARVIKIGGYLFIYTRLREQNRRNIWGKHFPQFNKKETRLYTMDAMKRYIEATPNLALESIVSFTYNRVSDLEQLIERAKSHHYSTFFLYSSEELGEAIEGFAKNIIGTFEDIQKINWFDENALFIIRKGV